MVKFPLDRRTDEGLARQGETPLRKGVEETFDLISGQCQRVTVSQRCLPASLNAPPSSVGLKRDDSGSEEGKGLAVPMALLYRVRKFS